MLTIDGGMGEGGGQVLRTALAHLTAVRAIAQVCGARVSGDALASPSLTFEPGEIAHGEHHFAVGTAGSATLVFQTVLPALLIAGGRSRLVFEGGTHNPMAPSFEFIARTFLPLLHRLGASVSAELERPGFYPAGGGRFVVELVGGAPLGALSLLERGPIESVSIEALVAGIPEHVAQREVQTLAVQLADLPIRTATAQVQSAGPGNVVTVALRSAGLTEVFTGFGEVGVRAETVALRVAGEVRKYLAADVPVGEHLADQLLLPLALAGGRGEFRTLPPTQHTRTNIDVIHRFAPDRVRLATEGRVAHISCSAKIGEVF
jgi:RNA 3'-terminal phosphate cyclase (ATP)